MAWRRHSSTSTRGPLRRLGTSPVVVVVVLLMFDVTSRSLKGECNWENFIGELSNIQVAAFDSMLVSLCQNLVAVTMMGDVAFWTRARPLLDFSLRSVSLKLGVGFRKVGFVGKIMFSRRCEPHFFDSLVAHQLLFYLASVLDTCLVGTHECELKTR